MSVCVCRNLQSVQKNAGKNRKSPQKSCRNTQVQPRICTYNKETEAVKAHIRKHIVCVCFGKIYIFVIKKKKEKNDMSFFSPREGEEIK